MKKVAFLFGVVSSVNAFGMMNVGSSNENTTQSMFNLSSNPSSNRSVYETEELCKQIADLEDKLQNANNKISHLQKQLDESNQYINSVEQEKNDLEQNKENLEKDKKKLERENNELKKKLNNSDESIKKTNNHIQQLEKKIDNLKNNSATQKITSMNSENNKQDEPSYDQLMQLRSQNQKLLEINKSLNTYIKELLNKNEILNTEKKELLNKNKILSDNYRKLSEENEFFRSEICEKESLSSDDENFSGFTLQSELGDSVFELEKSETAAPTPKVEISPSDWGPFRREEPIEDGQGTLLLKGSGKVKIEASRFIGNTIALSKAGDEIKFGWTTEKYSPVIWKLTGGDADKPFSISQDDFVNKQDWLISGSTLRVYSNNDDSIIASRDIVFKGTAKGVPQGFRLMKGTMINKNTRKVTEL